MVIKKIDKSKYNTLKLTLENIHYKKVIVYLRFNEWYSNDLDIEDIYYDKEEHKRLYIKLTNDSTLRQYFIKNIDIYQW